MHPCMCKQIHILYARTRVHARTHVHTCARKHISLYIVYIYIDMHIFRQQDGKGHVEAVISWQYTPD